MSGFQKFDKSQTNLSHSSHHQDQMFDTYAIVESFKCKLSIRTYAALLRRCSGVSHLAEIGGSKRFILPLQITSAGQRPYYFINTQGQ